MAQDERSPRFTRTEGPPAKLDRHKGVKHTFYVPADLDARLEVVRPTPVAKSKLLVVALTHYLEDAEAYGVDPKTLVPLSPPRPVPTSDDLAVPTPRR